MKPFNNSQGVKRIMLKRILGIALITTISAYGKSDEKTKATPAFTEATYAGTWESTCTKESDTTALKMTMTIAADKTVKQSGQLFSDNTCTSLLMTMDLYSTLAIAGEVDANTRKVNLSVTEFKITMNTDVAASDANAESTCGYTDWVKGTAKSCLGKSVDGTGPADFTSNTKKYNIFKVDGNILYAGEGTETEAQRPTTLKPTYTKK